MFKRKVNHGLGQFKLLDFYSNTPTLNKWIFHFRAISYQAIVQARTDREPKRASSVDSMLDNHYEFLRKNLLNDIRTAKTPDQHRKLKYALIGLRAFRQSNRLLVENIRKGNKETG